MAELLVLYFYRLVEVGKIEAPQVNGYYQAGQVMHSQDLHVDLYTPN